MTRVLEDGRLRLDDNPSESALRKVVLIRDRCLFAGSDDHAHAAGHILSLIAMASMHGLEPERYLRDMIRVLPFWPRDRYLELAPKFWAATRTRISQPQLLAEVGFIDVPPLAASAAADGYGRRLAASGSRSSQFAARRAERLDGAHAALTCNRPRRLGDLGAQRK